MIEGIRIDLSTAELREHLQQRVEFHAEKAKWYADRAQELKDVGSENKSNDPASSLRASAKDHENRRAFFAFVASHLIPDETYRLEESDFIRLEFSSRYF